MCDPDGGPIPDDPACEHCGAGWPDEELDWTDDDLDGLAIDVSPRVLFYLKLTMWGAFAGLVGFCGLCVYVALNYIGWI